MGDSRSGRRGVVTRAGALKASSAATPSLGRLSEGRWVAARRLLQRGSAAYTKPEFSLGSDSPAYPAKRE
jgi:hypothetical protein